jgi:TonB family protein
MLRELGVGALDFFCPMNLPAFVTFVAALAVAGTSLRAAEAPAPTSHGYTVMVEIKTNEQGEAENVRLLESEDISAGEVLSKMALAMAMKTKVAPRIKNGKPVKMTLRAPFFFPIEDDEGAEADKVPKPKVKEAIQPAYPLGLREQGVVGGVILELLVDAQGKLNKLTTVRSSHPEFEAAARESMEKWTFTPALRDGVAVESRTRFAFTFDTEQDMADLKWRIAPRPRLGSLTVIRPDKPIEDAPDPAAAPTSQSEAPAAAPEPTK